MENEEQRQRAQKFLGPMEAGARADFDEQDIGNLRTLVYLTVNFHDYLSSAQPWPEFPDDPFRDMSYVTESILIHTDAFRRTVHSYHLLDGATGSTINWAALNVGSIKGEFFRVYDACEGETSFEKRCRLLLDLIKLQIVFSGAFFDCLP